MGWPLTHMEYGAEITIKNINNYYWELIHRCTGFLFTNITGCVCIPEAESQIGELVCYCNNLKYWCFPYCLYNWWLNKTWIGQLIVSVFIFQCYN